MLGKQKSIKLNAFLSTLQTVMKIILPLITFPYVSRILGVEQLGKYDFSNSFVSYFVLLAGLGISAYAIREGAKYRNNQLELEKFAKEIFSINVFSMLGAYVLLAITIIFVPKVQDYTLLIIILSVQIVFATLGRGWLYTINEDYVFITIRTIILQFVSLVLLFVFVRDVEDVVVYTIITTISLSGNDFLNLMFSHKYCKLKFSFHINRKHLKPIFLIFSTAISITIYASTDTVMLGFFGTDYNVGLYSVSVKIYNIVKQLVAAVLVVTIPRFSYYIGQKKQDEYQNLFRKVCNMLMLILLPVMIGLTMVSQECILFISGVEYIEATMPLQLLSIALLFNLVSYMLGYCILLPNGKEQIFFKATLSGAIVNIVLNFILIPQFMQNAAAFTTVVSEFMVAVICFRETKKLISFRGITKGASSILLGCMWIVIVCLLIKLVSDNYLIVLGISITLSILGYFLILLLGKNQMCLEMLHKVLGSVKKVKDKYYE